MKLLPVILVILFTKTVYAVEAQPIYYGKVLEVQGTMGYKYLKVDENGTQHWVAIANAPVAVGDRIGYDKRTIMHDFESKSLGKTFKEIIFASDLYLHQKVQRPQSMKAMLGLGSEYPHKNMGRGMSPDDNEKPAKPFVKKDTYTVEEVHMWRKSLKGQPVSIEGTIFKVSHQIMKRDWVHLGDGTGNEKKLTDDLVFTSDSTTVKAGDRVIATGTVVVNKDFGYGYFYKVLIQDATFEVK